MKTVRRMIYMDVLISVGFSTLGFLGLFSFIDFVDELRWVDASNPAGYQVRHALMFVINSTRLGSSATTSPIVETRQSTLYYFGFGWNL